jgi:hypothetical protein
VPLPMSHSLNPHTHLLDVFIQVAYNKGIKTALNTVLASVHVKVKVILRPTVSRSVGQSVLVTGTHLGPATNFFFLFFFF